MKTRSERMRHRRPLPLEFLENRNLLSPLTTVPAAEVRQDQVMVPFKLSFEGTRTIKPTDQSNTFAIHVNTNQDSNGQYGMATQWGKFSLVEDFTIVGNPDLTVHVPGGSAIFTLKSTGEEVHATYEGDGRIYTPDFADQTTWYTVVKLNYTIHGGTGRYHDASGTFDLTQTAPTFGSPASVSASGVGSIAPPSALQSPAAITQSVRPDHEVPFKARTVYTLASPPDANPLIFAGTGNATHTGKFTADAEVVPDVVGGVLIGYHVHGTITAANGDQIFFEGVAQFDSPTTAEGTGDITGGTGRFKDATGDLTFNDVFTVENGTIVSDNQTTTGSISY